jgi:hypothetical protein
VEAQAKKMDFTPTLVLNAKFDSRERQDFARRLTAGSPIRRFRCREIVVEKSGVKLDWPSIR